MLSVVAGLPDRPGALPNRQLGSADSHQADRRTSRGMVGIGAVLAIALAFGWLGQGHQAGVLLVYVLATSAVVCGGVLLERRQMRPRPDELISWRRASGWLPLATFVVGFAGLGTVLVALTGVSSRPG
jgi:hypothetical protein